MPSVTQERRKPWPHHLLPPWLAPSPQPQPPADPHPAVSATPRSPPAVCSLHLDAPSSRVCLLQGQPFPPRVTAHLRVDCLSSCLAWSRRESRASFVWFSALYPGCGTQRGSLSTCPGCMNLCRAQGSLPWALTHHATQRRALPVLPNLLQPQFPNPNNGVVGCTSQSSDERAR